MGEIIGYMGGILGKKKVVSVFMEDCQIPEVNDMFVDPKTEISEIKEKHEAFTEAKTNFFKSMKTLSLPKSTVVSNIDVMIYSYSYFAKGEEEEIKLQFSESAPYIEIDEDKLSPEYIEIKKSWEVLLTVVSDVEHWVEEKKNEYTRLEQNLKIYVSETRKMLDEDDPIMCVRVLKSTYVNIQKIKHFLKLFKEMQDEIKHINDACAKIKEDQEYETNKDTRIHRFAEKNIKDYGHSVFVKKYWRTFNPPDKKRRKKQSKNQLQFNS